MNRIALIATVAVSSVLAAAERFEVRYFHDEDESSLSLSQIEFPSSKRGIAMGSISNGTRIRGAALLTSDGGSTWSIAPLPDIPVSFYCLDESSCWMVAQKGIWFSAEGGREWRRIYSGSGLRKVWFLNHERGFAAGSSKKLIETRDDGKTWTKMPVAAKLAERSERLTFSAITFITPELGMILGRSEPREDREGTPLWLSTEPEFRREHPTLSISLESRDGGENWKITENSMFGHVTRLRPDIKHNQGLVLLEFDRYFEFPSEIVRADFIKGTNQSVLRRRDFAATDIALLPGGTAFAAGFEPPGKLARTPVPGKVRVLRAGADLKLWTDVPVDYRAVAGRVSMAVPPDQSVWIATDHGMILRLVP